MFPTGRYAPSPTGSLHLGNLRTAVAACASIRARGGRFLLRIEDLDHGRCRPEFEVAQLRDLATLGLTWDDTPLRQSERGAVYDELLEELKERRLAYPCFCSRKDVAEAASAPHGAIPVYAGTCARLPWHEALARVADGQRHSWRLRIDEAPVLFHDGFQGEVAIGLRERGGDFVIKRADGYYAYQFACAVDDALSGMTEVLRGGDLLESGARQAYLLACLRRPVPRYLHIPLFHGSDGRRLAKRLGSEDMTAFLQRGFDATAILSYLAWTLGQIDSGERVTLPELATRWNLAKLPRTDAIFREEDLARFGG